MKKYYLRVTGILIYLILLALIIPFKWSRLIQPMPIIAVLSGMLILTLTQYKKTLASSELLYLARWNALFAGFITTLFSILSLITQANNSIIYSSFPERLIPLIYGTIIYLIIDWLLIIQTKKLPAEPSAKANPYFTLDVQRATQILARKGFSPRECHVALKILDGSSNKEIAQQLFISESTVKKHIQNMFRKCDVSDRQSFIEQYNIWDETEV